MKAAPGFELKEIDIPKVGDNDVLVKVKACSVCGTDVHIYNNDPPWDSRIKPPRTIGHEFTGVVEKTGKNVKRIKVGDTVANESHVFCGKCFQCKMGRIHTCQNIKALGIDQDGSYADYIACPEDNVFKISPNIPPHIATLHESLGNSVYTVYSAPSKDQTVVIFGPGPNGLFSTILEKYWGAKKVIVVGGTQEHLNLAKKCGADVVINRHNEDVLDRIKEETNGNGADVFLETSGSPAAIEQGLKSLRSGGHAVLLGLPKEKVTLDFSKDIVLKDITIKGIYGREIPKTWDVMKKLFADKKFDVSPVVTHKFKLEEFEKAIKIMSEGKGGKVVMFP